MIDPFATYDASYALGVLSAADRQAYEEHLSSCDACSRSVARLSAMPQLLRRLPAAEATALLGGQQPEAAGLGDAPADVPSGMLPALLADVRRRRRRRQWATALAGVAAAACVAAAVSFGLAGRPSAGPSPVQMSPVSAATPIRATAQLVDQPWGTHIVLHCTYDGTAAYAPGDYRLLVTDRAGHRQQVATWRVQPGQVTIVDSSTSVRDADIASVQVRNAADAPVLTLTP